MNIAIAHFRIGLTDGVSLEIEKRKKILQELGNTVYTIAGTGTNDINLIIPHLDYKNHPDIKKISQYAFFSTEQNGAIEDLLQEITHSVYQQLESFWQKTHFSCIFIHNLFSLPVCLPATLAFTEFLQKHPKIKGIAVHHDFYWEPSRRKIYKSYFPPIQKMIDTYFPPKIDNLHHCVINTIAQNYIKNEKKIDSLVISDTFDFDTEIEKENSYEEFKKDVGIKWDDIVFLSAVRIRRRKALGLGIDLVAEVIKMKKSLIGKKKYNGEVITEDSIIVLLMPGEYNSTELPYVELLKKEATEKGVEIKWIQNLVGSETQKKEGLRKYCLWDCYYNTDFVLYTSLWEGWGNQFIEAVYFKKPVVVFEYLVFKSDIQPVGFKTISLGDTLINGNESLRKVSAEALHTSAQETITILLDSQEYNTMVDNNYSLGKKYYNTNTKLKGHLIQVLSL
jgi:hypothetical protein